MCPHCTMVRVVVVKCCRRTKDLLLGTTVDIWHLPSFFVRLYHHFFGDGLVIRSSVGRRGKPHAGHRICSTHVICRATRLPPSITDFLQTNRVIQIGMAATCICVFIYGFSPKYWVALVARCLWWILATLMELNVFWQSLVGDYLIRIFRRARALFNWLLTPRIELKGFQ